MINARNNEPINNVNIDDLKTPQNYDSPLFGKKILVISDSQYDIDIILPALDKATAGNAREVFLPGEINIYQIMTILNKEKPALILIDKYLDGGKINMINEINLWNTFGCSGKMDYEGGSCKVVIYTADDGENDHSARRNNINQRPRYNIIHKPLLDSEVNKVIDKLCSPPISRDPSPRALNKTRNFVENDLLIRGVLERIDQVFGYFGEYLSEIEISDKVPNAIIASEYTPNKHAVKEIVDNWVTAKASIKDFFKSPQIYEMKVSEHFEAAAERVLDADKGLLKIMDDFISWLNSTEKYNRQEGEGILSNFWDAADQLLGIFKQMRPRIGGKGLRFADFFE